MTLAPLTAFTLLAFAANSLLCRMALGSELIDPVTFTSVRLGSGALALALIVRFTGERKPGDQASGSWVSGFALFAYAIAFSLAYVTLGAGIGALLLFGTVQITMIGAAIRAGDSIRAGQWVGLFAGVGGLVYLVLPGLTAPDPLGAALMAVAGIAWGVYSLRGKGSTAPIAMTAGNFARAVPFAALATVVSFPAFFLLYDGLWLAITSGVLTSGLGYVLWYRVLPKLSTTQASVLQLLVPILAAFGGAVVLDEVVTTRLLIASTLILGGVALTFVKRPPVAAR